MFASTPATPAFSFARIASIWWGPLSVVQAVSGFPQRGPALYPGFACLLLFLRETLQPLFASYVIFLFWFVCLSFFFSCFSG